MNSKYKMTLAVVAGAALGAAAIQGLHAQAKSPAYLITEVEVLNEAAFKELSPKLGKATQDAGGKYLARGGQVVALEGVAPKRVIVTMFENVDQAKASRSSAGWTSLAAEREKTVKTRAYIVEGLAK